MAPTPTASEMGSKGGRAGTARQTMARRRNILEALAKRHPASTQIQQQLARLQMEEAKARLKQGG